MSRVRLLVVSASLGGGGAERFASSLLRGLDRARFEPGLCLLRDEIRYPLPGDVATAVLGHGGPHRVVRTLLRLRRLIARSRPDVVLGCGAYTNLFVGEALRGAAAPRFVARVGDDPAHHPYGRLRRLQNLRLHRHYARAACTVANSAALGAAVARHFPRAAGRLRVLPNPVWFPPLAPEATPAAPLIAPAPGRAALLSIGRLHPQKRPLRLLEAFARMQSSGAAELWLCGEGPLREAIARRARALGVADRVKLLGFQRDPCGLARRAALVVSASAHEGLPYALIEAQGMGVPVVALRGAFGIDEVVRDGETGILVEPDDAGGLARACDSLLVDERRRRALGKRAAERARARYDAPEVIARWAGLLEAVARGAAPTEPAHAPAPLGARARYQE